MYALFEVFLPDELAGYERAVALFDDAHAVDRSDFAQNRLDVLVVYRNALRAVNFLYPVQEVMLHRLESLDLEQLLRIDVAFRQYLPLLYLNALFDSRKKVLRRRYIVGYTLFGAVFALFRDDYLALAVHLA